jgi:hypothetical protein
MASRVIQNSAFCGLVALLGMGCNRGSAWPPPPSNQREKQIIESATRAVDQIDGWTQVACVVERRRNGWRVQAWRIVYPQKQGRARCVPWAVRGITLNDEGKVLNYENHI